MAEERSSGESSAAATATAGDAVTRASAMAAAVGYLHVVIVAIVGAVSVLAWLWVFETVLSLLWDNDVLTANPWLFPAICLPFSLLVGLLVKYRHAPTNLDESLISSLSGDVTKINWRTLPDNILMAWASLFSGAVIGPEGGIGGIASKISIMYADAMRVRESTRPNLVFAAIASGYNGLVASPLFTGVLSNELIKDPAARGRTLPANLIGGAIGYVVFAGIGSTGLQDYLHLPTGDALTPSDLVLVVAFGLIGMLLAIGTGILFRVMATIFARFEGREVQRALVAGVAFSVVGMVAPIVMFSGETQILEVTSDPAKYGPAMLLVMAVLKLTLLAVAFKSGFLGGPTFPAIFASTCVALAIGLLFPQIPLDVLIGGIMAGFLLVLFRAPFMVILLTAIMLQADVNLLALIVLAVAAVMIVEPALVATLQRARAERTGAAAA